VYLLLRSRIIHEILLATTLIFNEHTRARTHHTHTPRARAHTHSASLITHFT